MSYYIHFINPHESAEHADTYFEGWHYGLHRKPEPAISPHFYEYQSKNLEAAEDLKKQLNAILDKQQ
ncbi:MAG TPA: hypothetical protein VJ201_03425 [Candidatus Babeliales bacterium]|nr:hypothetical protein [Candidatus Babeliales bacterium]